MRQRLRGLIAVCEIVFGEQLFFVEPQIAGDGAHEAAIRDAARELVPIFIFQSFQKSQADACGHNDFIGRDFAQLALVL